MKAIVQRVSKSSVSVDGEVVGCIGCGFNVLLGVVEGDDERDADVLAGKVARMRIFKDNEGKMNLSLADVGGGVLLISQFTLCADCKKGNRPSFITSAAPDEAKRLYEYFADKLRENGIENVQTGIFAAEMKVEISNDGPVTIILDSSIMHK